MTELEQYVRTYGLAPDSPRIDEVFGEIKRLREALEKAADWDVTHDGYTDLCELREMARAALSTTGSGK